MDYRTLVNNLNKGKIAPVYFFYGEEKYAIDEATAKVINTTVQDEVKDFNFDIFYASETDSGKILDAAASYPMMAERRTIVVKEIQKLSTTNLSALAKYAESPTPTTCLVLTASKGNLQGKAYTSLKSKTAALEFRPLYDNQVAGWIKQYVEGRGKMISAQATHLLHGYVGNSLLNLANELEKVFLNLEDREQIEAADIQSVVGFSKEFNIFHLLNSVGLRNLKKTLLIVDKLLEHGESPPGIIVRLTNHFATLLKFVELQKQRKSDRELAQVAGVHPYFVKEYKAQARNFTSKQIEKAFTLLIEADGNLKVSYQTPKIIVELLVYKLIKL